MQEGAINAYGGNLSNLVFMGMGEPLLNLPNVLEAIRILTDPKAFGMAPRRITVSTAGVVPKIRPLLDGARGRPAVDIDALADTLSRFSALVCALRDSVKEIDVNPLIAGPDGCIAVDALVVRG